MQVVAISGNPRENLGKKATKADRAAGLIPCVIYGGDEVHHFTTTPNEVKALIYTPDFKLAEIELNGTTYKSIVKEIQFHPVTDAILHIDFLRLVENHPIKVQVPVRFFGTSPGLKVGGKLIQNVRRIKIKTTPENLVDELKLDISNLELGESIRVRDIEVNDNIEIMMPSGTPVGTVEIPRALRSAAAAKAKEEA